MIRKEVHVSAAVLAEVKRIVESSEARRTAAAAAAAAASLNSSAVSQQRQRRWQRLLSPPPRAQLAARRANAPACPQIMKEDDSQWPEPDRIGRQELEIVCGNEHVSFVAAKIGSMLDVRASRDPEGARSRCVEHGGALRRASLTPSRHPARLFRPDRVLLRRAGLEGPGAVAGRAALQDQAGLIGRLAGCQLL